MLPSAKPLLGIFLLSTLLLANPSLALSNGTTVFDLLPQYGLPAGLLPDSIKDFSLSENGDFVIELEKPCYVQFEYLVYYDKKITGTLHYGSIKNLKGIQVKKFLFWVDVDEIKVDLPPKDFIYFDVGWITKKLQVTQFQTVHSCMKEQSYQGIWDALYQTKKRGCDYFEWGQLQIPKSKRGFTDEFM